MNVRKILEEENFNYKKKFGQNFLVDNNILDNILKVSDISKNTLVIEIGVGAAALTRKLSLVSGHVLGYEIDNTLKKPLSTILCNYDNVSIIYDDFLKRDIKKDIESYKYDEIMVVANLPYYITTPIITKFIEEKINVSKIVVMVQNEVANRFSAKVGTKDYNSLSIFLNYYFNINKAFFVPRNAFYPKPNVDSAIVIFKSKQNKIYVRDEKLFFNLIKDAFRQKRKTIKNNLKGYNLDLIDKTLKDYGKDINYRAEHITLEEFANISNEIAEHQ